MDLDRCLDCMPCKDYLSKKVPRALVEKILSAATKAYSPGNLQNWAFVIVDDEDKKERLALAAKNQHWIKQAPIVIVVCNNKDRIKDFFPAKGEVYSAQAIAAAAEIITLKAEDVGLSSCWVAGFDEKAVSRALNMPSNVSPLVLITIGYADYKKHVKKQTIDVSKLAHYNEYGRSYSIPTNFNLTRATKKLEKAMKKASKNILK